MPLSVIQRQLGHADLGITSTYLRGIDSTEIIHVVHERPAPMIPGSSPLASGLLDRGTEAFVVIHLKPSAMSPTRSCAVRRLEDRSDWV